MKLDLELGLFLLIIFPSHITCVVVESDHQRSTNLILLDRDQSKNFIIWKKIMINVNYSTTPQFSNTHANLKCNVLILKFLCDNSARYPKNARKRNKEYKISKFC